MDVLWAPWRSKYVSEASKGSKEDCLFCRVNKENKDERNYVVYTGKYAFVMLNAFPYNTAHVMIAPYRHISTIELMVSEEALDMFDLANIVIKAIRNAYNPDGFNIGFNIGRVAGAGIESHLHMHIVPRWNGDSNFMPIISNTKVIPESLDDTFKKISSSIKEIMKKSSSTES
ncbi:HIT family hydrolase [Sulfolobus sp. B5]|nr:HIT family hydrolase [Sulfolobus sp. B5]